MQCLFQGQLGLKISLVLCTFFNSIVWLQNQRDQNAERTRGGGLGMGVGRGPGFGGRDDFHEFRVGRIKHERVKVRKFPSTI